jgi:hypothetical protein
MVELKKGKTKVARDVTGARREPYEGPASATEKGPHRERPLFKPNRGEVRNATLLKSDV